MTRVHFYKIIILIISIVLIFSFSNVDVYADNDINNIISALKGEEIIDTFDEDLSNKKNKVDLKIESKDIDVYKIVDVILINRKNNEKYNKTIDLTQSNSATIDLPCGKYKVKAISNDKEIKLKKKNFDFASDEHYEIILKIKEPNALLIFFIDFLKINGISIIVISALIYVYKKIKNKKHVEE